MAFENKEGVPVFPATLFARSSQLLHDNSGKFMQVKIPTEVFYHQMLIAGRTGSGKTVAMKYMMQYFAEELHGAVLAVNVKEEDLLTMDRPSQIDDKGIMKEWADLDLKPHGVDSFSVYYPQENPTYSKAVNSENCERITLSTMEVEPESLSGLIPDISEKGSTQLPGIFRYWKAKNAGAKSRLIDFLNYFADKEKENDYRALSANGEEYVIPMHSGTKQNIERALTDALNYFDVAGAKKLNAQEILQRGKISVVDITHKGSFGFGSVLLRDLLDKIYEAKSGKDIDIPVLVVIDEVHEFYGNARSREALQTLDSICRLGRGLEMAVIFASQNPQDMPKGLESVVNTKIYFKSDIQSIRELGIPLSGFDPEALKAGYGVARIHGLSQLRFVKFPLALAGVQKLKITKNGS